MNTRGAQVNTVAIALAVFAALLIQGCSSERNETLLGPRAQALSGGPAVLSAFYLGDGSVSQSINGSVGGQVSNGRFTLTVPAGAFTGTRTITVALSEVDELQCELYPEGLQFSVPATLAISLSGTSLDDDSAATVAWYNPGAAVWVDMNGAFDVATHSVRAALPHFSIYRGIRAGW
jgi:hypothetical protein